MCAYSNSPCRSRNRSWWSLLSDDISPLRQVSFVAVRCMFVSVTIRYIVLSFSNRSAGLKVPAMRQPYQASRKVPEEPRGIKTFITRKSRTPPLLLFPWHTHAALLASPCNDEWLRPPDFDEDMVPKSNSMTNTNVTCEALAKQRGGRGTSASSSYPCSEGSTCLDGDLGVYCQCYERESSWEQVRDIRVLLVAPLGTVDLQASKSKELCLVACTLPGTELSIYRCQLPGYHREMRSPIPGSPRCRPSSVYYSSP